MIAGMTDSSAPGEVLARNVAAARVRRGLQQKDIAERMNALGYQRWYAQTASATERGQRRLTADELPGLALALQTTVARLMAPNADDGEMVLPSGLTLAADVAEDLISGAAPRVRWNEHNGFVSAEIREGQ